MHMDNPLRSSREFVGGGRTSTYSCLSVSHIVHHTMIGRSMARQMAYLLQKKYLRDRRYA